MTPNEALTALEKNSLELLEAISDEGTVSGDVSNKTIPCGGLGGNEFNKVRHVYIAGGESTSDLDSVLRSAEAKITKMDLSISGRGLAPAGTRLAFTGPGFGGELIINSDRLISLNAETECLDNPDQ